MRIVLALAAAVLVGLAPACGSSPAGGGATVVAGFYPLAWAATVIGGKSARVTNLTPSGAEPHDIELTPRAVAQIQKADVVLYASHDFQPAVEQAARAASGTTVDALSGLSLRAGIGGEANKPDAHVWLDPVLFARVVRHIGGALHKPVAGAELARRVLALDRAYRRGLAHCARRTFVTSHAAFGYLAARYDLRQVAITGLDPEAEPSAQKLAQLAELVRREHISTVFFERLVSPSLAETVAREAGAKTAVLDPIEGLTAAEASRGADYLTLMRGNLAALRSALGCR